MLFIQQLINGFSVGSVYALMAVGYSLIYSLLNFSNFAHSAAVAVSLPSSSSLPHCSAPSSLSPWLRLQL